MSQKFRARDRPRDHTGVNKPVDQWMAQQPPTIGGCKIQKSLIRVEARHAMPHAMSPNIPGRGGLAGHRSLDPVMSPQNQQRTATSFAPSSPPHDRQPPPLYPSPAGSTTNTTAYADWNTPTPFDMTAENCHHEVSVHAEAILQWLQWDAANDFAQFQTLPSETRENLLHIGESLRESHDNATMEDGEHDEANSCTDQPTRTQHRRQSEIELLLAKSIDRITMENQELKAQIARQPPRYPAPRTEASIHATSNHKTQKSANPIPIIPSRKSAPQNHASLPPRQKPTSPTQRHHESRLIVHFMPRIDPKTLGPLGRIVQEINEALHTLSPPAPDHIGVKGMMTSEISGSPIIVAADSCTASNLETYADIITRIVAGEAHYDLAEAKADRQRFEVCLENILLRSYLGHELQPEDIASVVAATSGQREGLQLATLPRFMISFDDRMVKIRAPVRLSFLDNEQARKVLLTKTFFFDGIPCTAWPYIERRPIVYCRQCSSLGHRENSQGCKGPRCEICASGDHVTTSHQPSDPPPKCINCAGPHSSRTHECPARKQPADNLRTTAGGQNPRGQPKPGTKSKNTRIGTKDAEGFTQIPATQNPMLPRHTNASPYTLNLRRLDREATPPGPHIQPEPAPGPPTAPQAWPSQKDDNRMKEF